MAFSVSDRSLRGAPSFQDLGLPVRVESEMKLKTSRAQLLKPLQLVAGVVERRQTLPILANVLLRVDEGELSMTGTDLEVELVSRVPLTDCEPGEVTVPARKLMEICRQLAEGAELTLASSDQRLSIQSGRFRSTLSVLPASEFPAVDQSEVTARLAVPRAGLRELIERTSFAMAQQDVRYFLNGMLLEASEGRIRAVATDGHRLALSELRREGLQEKRQVIIPRKGVQELQRLLGEEGAEVMILLGSNHFCAEIGPYRLTTKLVDGKFPEYERVIPRNGNKVIIADTDELRQALNRTAILSNEKFRGIRVAISSGNLQVSANNPEQEEAEESVSVDYQGEPMEIGFNVGYLIDVLTVLGSERVKITVLDANNSALLEEPDNDSSVYVVMPMKL